MLSGNAICSNTTFEFTCIVSDVDTVGWRKNDDMILIRWNINSKSTLMSFEYRDQFEVHLDNFNTSTVKGREVFTNLTTRLIGTVDQSLHSGDEIRCLGTGFTTPQVMRSLNLNYSIVTGKYLGSTSCVQLSCIFMITHRSPTRACRFFFSTTLS